MGEEKNMQTAHKEAAEKLTYDQLDNIAHQLSEQSRNLNIQNQKLVKALEEANMTNYFKRLDYLWAVIHSESKYISEEFKSSCGKEFETMMTPSEESDNKE